MSAFNTYLNARDSTLRNGERSRAEFAQQNERNLLREASQAYASGDTDGTRNALAQAGDIGSIMSLDRNTAQADKEFTTGRLADNVRAKTEVLGYAQGLLRLPEAQWGATFTTQIAPKLTAMGIPQATIDQVAADGLTRQEVEYFISTLGGEVENAWENDRSGPDGSVLRPNAEGQYSSVYTPPFDPRDGAPSGFAWTDATRTGLTPIKDGPADPAYLGRRGVATRAPPRGRSSGGRSGGSSRSAPSAPARKPWERY